MPKISYAKKQPKNEGLDIPFGIEEKDNTKSAIIISSVTFGIGHLLNLFSNGLENIIPNICQVFYAMKFL